MAGTPLNPQRLGAAMEELGVDLKARAEALEAELSREREARERLIGACDRYMEVESSRGATADEYQALEDAVAAAREALSATGRET